MSTKHPFIIAGSLLLITSFSSVDQVRADWFIDLSGTLIEVDGLILGRANGITTPETLEVTQAAKQKLETATQARIKSQDSLQQMTQSRLEVKEGAVMQVQQAVMNQDGQVVRRNQADFAKGEKLKVERPDGRSFQLSADDQGQFEIESDSFKARTSHPISIGEDNQLIITRPDGSEKVVSVLPDTAAENLRSRGLAVAADEVELENLGDDLVYRFPVQEEKRFLGIFKRLYNQEAVVSAETGAVIDTTSTETSPWTSFLESLSF